MRIVVVNNFFPPRVGGSSHLSALLAKHYVEAGHEVLVITGAYADAPETEERHGYRIVRLPVARMPQLGLSIDFDITFAARWSNMRRIKKLLREFCPDVIHQHGQFLDLSWMTGRWAAKNDVPVLLSIHTRLENPNRVYALLFAALDYLVVRPLVNYYDPHMVVMDRLMDAYIRGRYGTGEARLVDIPVGVDLTQFKVPGDGARVREQWGLGDKPVIVSLGHVIPLRDRVLLIEALPGILRQHPETMVVVVGKVHHDAFLRLANTFGVEDHVLCVGPVPPSEVPDYLAAGQVETHDLQGFGLGTASLEAMAAGTPIVAAVRMDNFRGIELRNGENIVLVSEGRPAELCGAISQILSDPAGAQLIAKEQVDLAERCFSIEAVTQAHLDTFERLVDQRRSAR
ncbi:MAG TPA: glycosyltransferase family 4 protein [Microthrixaceae bacterium]|nr:glycosyltransferase family 4 protein [Microthrixaceae bacterium]HQF95215.1 glycosyltransferase family 4 protein [Microthrixaceae bacterium]